MLLQFLEYVFVIYAYIVFNPVFKVYLLMN